MAIVARRVARLKSQWRGSKDWRCSKLQIAKWATRLLKSTKSTKAQTSAEIVCQQRTLLSSQLPKRAFSILFRRSKFETIPLMITPLRTSQLLWKLRMWLNRSRLSVTIKWLNRNRFCEISRWPSLSRLCARKKKLDLNKSCVINKWLSLSRLCVKRIWLGLNRSCVMSRWLSHRRLWAKGKLLDANSSCMMSRWLSHSRLYARRKWRIPSRSCAMKAMHSGNQIWVAARFPSMSLRWNKQRLALLRLRGLIAFRKRNDRQLLLIGNKRLRELHTKHSKRVRKFLRRSRSLRKCLKLSKELSRCRLSNKTKPSKGLSRCRQSNKPKLSRGLSRCRLSSKTKLSRGLSRCRLSSKLKPLQRQQLSSKEAKTSAKLPKQSQCAHSQILNHLTCRLLALGMRDNSMWNR